MLVWRLVGCSSSLVIRTIGSFSNNCGISVQVKYLIIDVFSVRKALGLPSKKPKIASGGSGQIPNFFVILEYNLYPFIIRTLGGLSDFEVTNCQPFLLLHSALICFLGISLCHKGNTFLSNMCCVL